MKLSTFKNLATACIMLASVAGTAAQNGGEALSGKGKSGVKLVNKASGGNNAQAGVSVTIQLPGLQSTPWMPRPDVPGFSPVASIYYPNDQYSQLEGLCTSAIQTLKMAIEDANFAAAGQSGSAGSVQALYQGLIDANREFGMFGGRNRANAHTLVAIKSALNLAKVVVEQLPQFYGQLHWGVAPLQDSIMRRLYTYVLETNLNLDQQFFGQIRQCRSMNCYIRSLQQFDIFGGQYFGNLVTQAQSLIDISLNPSRPLGPALFKAVFMAHTVFETSELLATSPFAVDFACPVNNMLKVAADLNKAVIGYNPANPTANIMILQAVQTASWKMSAIRADIGNSYCGQGYGSQWQQNGGGHHGGHQVGYESENDGGDDVMVQSPKIKIKGKNNTVILQQQNND
jgi:hypothetical protein